MADSQVKTKRNTTIDFAKGLTILLMLWGHLCPDTIWINTFHMPLFFILSGYFTKDESFKTTLVKKARGLLIPYLIMELILVVSSVIFIGIRDNLSFSNLTDWAMPIVLPRLQGTLLANNMCISWFVWVLFAASCLYGLINKLRKRLPVLYALIIIICSICGYFFCTSWLFRPYRWDVVLYVIPFLAVGHLYRLFQPNIKNYLKWILLAVSLIIWIVDIIFTDEYAIAMSALGFYPLTLFGAIGGTYVVVFICSLLDKIPVLNTVIRWFGQNTVVIICFAVVPTNVMEWYDDAYTGNVVLSFIIQIAIVSVLILLKNGIQLLTHKLKEEYT